MPKGCFVTFEGGEGVGKSTQIRLLAERLSAQGREVLCLREPGGTQIGEEIRHTLQHSMDNRAMTAETELLLMNASRAQLVREVIRPALQSGKCVLCDRFYDSTVAYQGYGRQLPMTQVLQVIELAVGATKPDLTVWLTLPPEVSESRRQARQAGGEGKRDRMEEQSPEFYNRVARGFEQWAGEHPQRIRRVDATGTVDEVQNRIWEIFLRVHGEI